MSLKNRIATLAGLSGRSEVQRVASIPIETIGLDTPLHATSNQLEGLDTKFYLSANSDVRIAGVDPAQHYMTHGWKEGRNPSAEFDTVFYRMAVCGATDPDLCPLVHYNDTGRSAGAPKNRAESLEMGGYHQEADALIRAIPDLALAFDEARYVDRYPDIALSDLSPLEHYLTNGWKLGHAPSDSFDTLYYRETFQHNDAADLCPLVHYLLYGRKAGLPVSRDVARARALALQADRTADASLPLLENLDRETATVLGAPHFSATHYLATYPDVAVTGVSAWWHYCNVGWTLGYEPKPIFDSGWYARKFMPSEAIANLSPLLHYATIGRMARWPASQAMATVHLDQTVDAAFGDAMRAMLSQLGFDVRLLDFDRVRRFVLPMFSAPTYRKLRGLDDGISDADSFLRYLQLDFPAGMPPGPMFSPAHYLAQVQRRGITPPRLDEAPLHHWLRHGVVAGLSPTPGFDADDYLKLNPDLAGYPDSLHEHFIRHGQHEGRRFNALTLVAPSRLARLSGDIATRARVFCEAMSAGADGAELSKMHDFLSSGRLESTIRATAEGEPDVGGLDQNMLSLLPPWHDEAWMEYSQILRLLPQGQFDSVVLMPFCKLGGADFVAGVLTSALSETGHVLVLRTDADDWTRPDWFPDNVVTVDLSAHMNAINPGTRMRMLYELLVRLRPSAIYNVNSRLAFDTYVRYGERLSRLSKLYAYYFCADRTPDGVEAGYPVWFFSNILPYLSGAMIDNRSLADQLIARYNLSGPYRERVRLLYTPAMTDPPETTVANAQQAEPNRRSRKRVLWAGRLDAQKRFDLVQDIARLLPEVDFDCWGKAVLDAPPDLSSLPPNLKVHGPFKTYDELPLAQSDGWLYTSGWDGMPTILIELAAMGVPMVASAVGGVAELIDETTGWPMHEGATSEDYAKEVEQMIASPQERVVRASALQMRVRKQHSREAYRAALAGFGSNDTIRGT
jgi:glycosyltransferase involved in cell wall biosynthesis